MSIVCGLEKRPSAQASNNQGQPHRLLSRSKIIVAPMHKKSRWLSIESEQSLLRALAQLPAADSLRPRLHEKLSGYRWQEPLHVVLYDALQQIRSEDPQIIRSRVEEVLVRFGFPDVETDFLNTDLPIDRKQIERDLARLQIA
jgi:hypothetical protein